MREQRDKLLRIITTTTLLSFKQFEINMIVKQKTK